MPTSGPRSFGRFEWTVDGEDYFKQYMPPSVVDMEFTADDLIAEMDYAEVDWALLHRTPYLGIGNDLVADAARAYPDHIQALAHVPEWKIAPDPDWAIGELDHAVNDLGLHGLQLLPDHMALYGQSTDWVTVGPHSVLGPLRHAGRAPVRDTWLHVIGAHRQRRRHGLERV